MYEEFIRSIFIVMTRKEADRNVSKAGLYKSKSPSHRNCVEILTQLLTNKEETGKHKRHRPQSLDYLQRGLEVDWYEMFEPEIVNVHPLQQRQMLFNDISNTNDGSSPLTIRQSNTLYLLALLTHQSSWSSLQDTLDWLLSLETGKWKRYIQN